LPRLDAIAARDSSGKLWIEFTNLDPENPLQVDVELTGVAAKSASGETLTAPKVDSVNSFDARNTVAPKPTAVKLQGNTLTMTLAPKSLTVVLIQE